MESRRERAQGKKSTEDLKAERQSDATDDEVLREEESRTSSASKGGGSDVTPSPDGSFDQKEERDKAGPM
jgi:hypothetical protein